MDRWDGFPDNPNDDGEHWVKHPEAVGPELKYWDALFKTWRASEHEDDDGVGPADCAAIYAYVEPVAPCGTLARLREPSAAMLAAAVPFPMHLAAEHRDPMDPWYAAMHAAVTAQRLAVRQYWLAMAEAMLQEIEA